MVDTKSLRQQCRRARRNVPPAERECAGLQLARHLERMLLFRKSARIACFVSAEDEIPTRPIIETIWAQQKNCYLPVCVPATAHLQFHSFAPGSPLKGNCYGIPEPLPRTSHYLPTWALDMVLMPLVGFDKQGNRLGMGAGFYDRSFAFKHGPDHKGRPWLIGLAYDCQQVDALPAQPWDVPLHGVITESGLKWFS